MKKKANCGSGQGSRAHARQYRVFSFGDRLRVSRFVGQALATEAFQRSLGTGHIVHAQPFPVAVAEIELRQIPMQVRFADMEVAAGDAPLQDAEVVLDGVGVSVAADVFVRLVGYAFMVEVATHMAVLAGIVGVQLGLPVDLSHDDRPQVRGGDAGDVHGADATIALDQRARGFLAPAPAQTALGALATMAVLFLAADEGFIGLYCLAFAAQRSQRTTLHGLANAMGQEPSGLHAALQHPLNLPGRDALLAGAHQVDHLQPQMQGQVRGFEDGPDPDGEGFPAGVALVQALPGGLALQPADVIARRAAMRAERAIGPQGRLDVCESRILVVEMRCGKN